MLLFIKSGSQRFANSLILIVGVSRLLPHSVRSWSFWGVFNETKPQNYVPLFVPSVLTEASFWRSSETQKPPLHMQRWFCFIVGVSRFELPAPRPPDAYSNLTELHPDDGMGVGVMVCVGECDVISAGQI